MIRCRSIESSRSSFARSHRDRSTVLAVATRQGRIKSAFLQLVVKLKHHITIKHPPSHATLPSNDTRRSKQPVITVPTVRLTVSISDFTAIDGRLAFCAFQASFMPTSVDGVDLWLGSGGRRQQLERGTAQQLGRRAKEVVDSLLRQSKPSFRNPRRYHHRLPTLRVLLPLSLADSSHATGHLVRPGSLAAGSTEGAAVTSTAKNWVGQLWW
jgi:hypothetical protein